MLTTANVAEIAGLVGEPARAAMLLALMEGRALSAGELARAAGVAAPTASGHLGRMDAAGLLAIERQGRHRYHRLASPAVAAMLESIMAVAGQAVRRPVVRTGPRDAALRRARTCYDHLAGRIAVAVADRMIARGGLELSADGGVLTGRGEALLRAIGADPDAIRAASRGRRTWCRPCMDWSERRPHLGGAVGAALLDAYLGNGWMRRVQGSRAVTVTPAGRLALDRAFGFDPVVWDD
ncbi:DNA-binding transcriptional ArsR family regulator [Sphingomonas naasensis]|uniref:Transcriptional regulator n=1 Tax=Sphingomonas naasensis TaxID=1344951 RepID=A0A4S1WD46_9SPHN|nr:helix-turn-helix transcriptional regulator [Sphingomonas naasensis]NIJ22210.1 DNA-binding transcriptional ArsR family regulator [Sphingomonas naasensis]TGX40769.1 transcriptional regulator [Sphingomonas naasensis]